MLTEGIIISIDQSSNKCTVRLPIFELAGNFEHALTEALLCVQPGQYGGYRVDDIVWVGFENNQIDQAVIIGRVYTSLDEMQDSIGAGAFNTLQVTQKATLPLSTTIIIDEDTTTTIKKLLDRISTLETYVNTLIERDEAGSGEGYISPSNLLVYEEDEGGTRTELNTSDIYAEDEETGEETPFKNLRFEEDDETTGDASQ